MKITITYTQDEAEKTLRFVEELRMMLSLRTKCGAQQPYEVTVAEVRDSYQQFSRKGWK